MSILTYSCRAVVIDPALTPSLQAPSSIHSPNTSNSREILLHLYRDTSPAVGKFLNSRDNVLAVVTKLVNSQLIARFLCPHEPQGDEVEEG